MPIMLADVVARVKAADSDLEDDRARRLVMEAIAGCGWEVARDGEVFNPAEGAYRPRPVRVVARDQKFSTRKR